MCWQFKHGTQVHYNEGSKSNTVPSYTQTKLEADWIREIFAIIRFRTFHLFVYRNAQRWTQLYLSLKTYFTVLRNKAWREHMDNRKRKIHNKELQKSQSLVGICGTCSMHREDVCIILEEKMVTLWTLILLTQRKNWNSEITNHKPDFVDTTIPLHRIYSDLLAFISLMEPKIYIHHHHLLPPFLLL